jgi:hypothetical protein
MDKHAITRTELNRAIAAFRRRGGLIRLLPPEKTRKDCRVGTRYGQYEEVLASAGPVNDEPAAS